MRAGGGREQGDLEDADGAPDPGEVLRRLTRRFGPREKPRLPPLDELILTILSQSTTDANRDRAWAALRETFPTWEAVLESGREELEEVIRPAGLAGQKARAIRGALARLIEDRGEASLDHLTAMTDEEALEYLTGFYGVGLKTAACVLCFSLRRDVLPVDTHVHRVAGRLGWILPRKDPTSAHELLAERVAPGDRFPLHLQLITLGRETCRARDPRCPECPLEDLCPREGVELEEDVADG